MPRVFFDLQSRVNSMCCKNTLLKSVFEESFLQNVSEAEATHKKTRVSFLGSFFGQAKNEQNVSWASKKVLMLFARTKKCEQNPV